MSPYVYVTQSALKPGQFDLELSSLMITIIIETEHLQEDKKSQKLLNRKQWTT